MGREKLTPKLDPANTVSAALAFVPPSPLCGFGGQSEPVAVRGRLWESPCSLRRVARPCPAVLVLSCEEPAVRGARRGLSSGRGHLNSPFTPSALRLVWLSAERGSCTVVSAPELYQALRDCSAGSKTFQPSIHFAFK